MSTSTQTTETKTTTDTSPSGYGEAPPAVETPEVETPKTDDFGYDTPKVETPVEEVKTDELKTDTPAEEPKVEKPATGYDTPAEEVKVEKPAEEKVKEEEVKTDEKTQEQLKEEIDQVLGELGDYDKKLISEFAAENKMSKEQVQAYVKMVKSENDKGQINAKEQRNTWKKELLSDGEFGGNDENFDKNVQRVEQILEKHLPNTKKILTDRGSMLPPYIMKDLLGLHKMLNPTTELVNGDASKPVEKKGNFLDEMYK